MIWPSRRPATSRIRYSRWCGARSQPTWRPFSPAADARSMRGMRRSRPSRSRSTTKRTPSATSTRSTSWVEHEKSGMKRIIQIVSGMEGYDPDALPVEKAREARRACITPITADEKGPARSAPGRVLAEEIVPGINVPSHDNSAMDGYAVRFADLEQPLTEIGTALAGKPFSGAVGAGECVRIMTGAVIPAGADTVVIQEVVKREGNRISVPPGQKR